MKHLRFMAICMLFACLLMATARAADDVPDASWILDGEWPTEGSGVTVAYGTDSMVVNNRAFFMSDNSEYGVFVQDDELVMGSKSGSDSENMSIEFDGVLFQYYAWKNSLSDTGEASRGMSVVDTSGGVLPTNDKVPASRYLYLEADGNVRYDLGLVEMYRARDVAKEDILSINQMNRFTKETDYYVVDELWVAETGDYAKSIDDVDWTVYDWSDDLRLSTSIEDADSDPNVIFIDTGYVVRFVCSPKSGETTKPATFYDYDITDGNIYGSKDDARAKVNAIGTGQQDALEASGATIYVNTIKEGINSDDNYDDLSKPKFGFGNQNTANGRADELLDGMYPMNKVNRSATHFKFNTFGLARGLDADGHIIYNEGISVPKLFDDGDAIGKTVIEGHELEFLREGESYVLESVSDTNAKELSTFHNPGIYDGVQNPSVIWTNDFWPLDDMGTFGTDGHDLKFGTSDWDYRGRRLQSSARGDGDDLGNFPESDDGTDHNSYFGMQFSIDFEVADDYVGPLEYVFFGDDDMWVFLDGRLISDIGGVHPSAGSYVNLWDYIDEDDIGRHQLKFYFIERGASGSTCWMRFHVPHVYDALDIDNFGDLRIEKAVDGNATDEEFEFRVDFDFYDVVGDITNNEFTYTGSREGTIKSGQTLKLKAGEYVTIQDIPFDTKYTVTETEDRAWISRNTGAIGIVSEEVSVASFVNTRAVGGLKITKAMAADAGKPDVKFPFTVRFMDADGNELTDEFDYTGSSAGKVKSGDVIELGPDESVTITGIPIDVEYSVTEGDTVGYILADSTNTVGTIVLDTVVEAVFVNKEANLPKMPETGGPGIGFVCVSGLAVLLFGIMVLVRKRKC